MSDKALRVEIVARDIPEVVRELTALRRQVRVLRDRLQVAMTYMDTRLPGYEQAAERVCRVYRLTAPKEDKRAE